jgi:transcriptional regulator with XRE-family HTH domain
MDDRRFGRGLRELRRRRKWRQVDLAAVARVSRQFVSKVERGLLEGADLARIRRIADALGVRVQFTIIGDGGEIDRLIDRGHARLHELAARMFRALPEWISEPEVSFSIYGERGIIDVVAWHPVRRALLIIELKTSFVDISALIGAMDRRRRLARRIARERGWDPATVSVWVIVEDTPANHRTLARHATVLRSAFPVDGRTMRAWLRQPVRPVAALSFLSVSTVGGDRRIVG